MIYAVVSSNFSPSGNKSIRTTVFSVSSPAAFAPMMRTWLFPMKTPAATSAANSETKGKKVYNAIDRRSPTCIGNTQTHGASGGPYANGSVHVSGAQSIQLPSKIEFKNHIINDLVRQKVHLPVLGGGGGSARIGGSRGRFGLCRDEAEGGILG